MKQHYRLGNSIINRKEAWPAGYCLGNILN